MVDHDTGGNACIGRDRFVSRVAVYDAVVGRADYSSKHKGGGSVTVLGWKLGETGRVVIDDCAGRDAMDEAAGLECGVRKRARECRGSGRYDFSHAHMGSLKIVDELQ